jgi:predicted site-specific integrase-resolvase
MMRSIRNIRYVHTSEGGIRKGNRLYCIQDVYKAFGVISKPVEKITICYARVSSSHQKEDLDRQVELLTKKYPSGKLYKDVGSGLNWKRSGLLSVLELVNQGVVDQIVVSYKDRLCRFGCELLEWIFEKNNVKLLVLNKNCDTNNPSEELAEDLLAITTVFVARNNGIRSGKYRRGRSKKNKESEIETNKGTEKDTE